MEEKYKSFFRIAGFPLDQDQERRFEIYLSELKKWGQRMNLTALHKDEDIIKTLFLSSLSFSAVLSLPNTGEVMDYGSGAGFPGLPLKIRYPSLKMTLLEANRKKWVFLKHLCRELGFLDCLCLNQRGEDLVGEEAFQARYGALVSRAVGQWERILEQAAILLAEGGICVFYQARAWREGDTGGGQVTQRIKMPLTEAFRWRCEALGMSHWLIIYRNSSR